MCNYGVHYPFTNCVFFLGIWYAQYTILDAMFYSMTAIFKSLIRDRIKFINQINRYKSMYFDWYLAILNIPKE